MKFTLIFTLFFINFCFGNLHETEIKKMNANALKKSQELINSDEFRKEYNLLNIEKGYKNSSNIFVFISFSMPNNLLLQYLEEAKRYNATLILRGFIKGADGRHSVPRTMQKIKEISKNGGSNIMVHPKLFQVFDVARVPSIVQIKDSFECLENGSLCDEQNVSYDKITGSVSIKYALEQFNDL